MKGFKKMARGSNKALAVLGWSGLILLSVTATGSLGAGVSLIGSPFVVPVALTRGVDGTGGAYAPPESRLRMREMTVSAGDTLASMLAIAAIDRRDVAAAMTVLRKRFDPRKLSIGRKLFVIVETQNRGAARLVSFGLEMSKTAYLIIEKRARRRFVSRYTARPPRLGVDGYGEKQTLRVRAGDSLIHMLLRAGVDRDAADKASHSIDGLFNLRRLQIGQEVVLSFAPSGDRSVLTGVGLKIARDAYVAALRDGNGNYTARRSTRPVAATAVAVSAKAAPVIDADDDTRQIYRIGKGDTLTGALIRAGVDRKPAYAVAEAIGRHVNLRKLRVGWELIPVFDPGTAMRKAGLAAVSLKLKPGNYVVASRDEAGGFTAETAVAPLLPIFPVDDLPAAAPPLQLSAAASYKVLRLRRGDSLTTALLRIGGAWKDTDAVVSALTRLVDPHRLKVGQKLSAVLDKTGRGAARPRLIAVSLTMGEGSYVVARLNDDAGFTARRARDPLDAIFDEALAAAPPPIIELSPIPATALHKSIDLRPGGTLMKALLQAGSRSHDAGAAIIALKPLFDPRKLRAGQPLELSFMPGDNAEKARLHRLTIGVSPGRSIEVGRVEGGGFKARAVEAPLERLMVLAGGTIESSLYKAAVDAGVPLPVLLEMISAFSYDVDFQREIQPGDGFAVLFERYLDETGAAVREGNTIYAALTLSGTQIKIYRHTAADGFADYYNEAGNSVRKALLRTPIDGARLTSGYGRRKHPILGYTKMHRGVDFGARRGTPFMAAGDGVVEAAGWNGSYGNYIRIRHRGGYSTAYAHLSRIASGIRKGSRVKQGRIIGFVGSTGRSTGPHLHYEVILAGKQVNPLKVKLPTGAKLKGAALAAFQKSRAEIENQLAALPLVGRVADAAPAMRK